MDRSRLSFYLQDLIGKAAKKVIKYFGNFAVYSGIIGA
jgi:hypothetical protein